MIGAGVSGISSRGVRYARLAFVPWCMQYNRQSLPLSMVLHTMDFKTATDRLTRRVTHEEIADALNRKVATIRQARLSEGANAKRSAPPGWQRVVAQLAEERAAELGDLARTLREGAST